MILNGVNDWDYSGWRIDGKRPTNATNKSRIVQSVCDKQKRKTKLKNLLRG